MQEKNLKKGFRLPYLLAVEQRHKSVRTIMMRLLMQLTKLLLQLMALLVWVLIYPVYLIWFFLSRARASSELSKASEEVLEKPTTKTLSRYGMLRRPANLPRGTLRNVKNSTKKRNTRTTFRK